MNERLLINEGGCRYGPAVVTVVGATVVELGEAVVGGVFAGAVVVGAGTVVVVPGTVVVVEGGAVVVVVPRPSGYWTVPGAGGERVRPATRLPHGKSPR